MILNCKFPFIFLQKKCIKYVLTVWEIDNLNVLRLINDDKCANFWEELSLFWYFLFSSLKWNVRSIIMLACGYTSGHYNWFQ